MFSHARDLGPNYEMLPEDYPHANGSGFVHAWQTGLFPQKIEEDVALIKEDIKKLKCMTPPLGVGVQEEIYTFWRDFDVRISKVPPEPKGKPSKTSLRKRNAERNARRG